MSRDGASTTTDALPPAEDDDRPRQRGIRAALVSLAPPDPSERFWDRLGGVLGAQDQLDIVTRPAVRAITEPPPISQPTLDDDPRHGLAAYRPSSVVRPDGIQGRVGDADEARRRRLAVLVIAAAALVVLIGGSILGGGDSPAPPAANTSAPNPDAAVQAGQTTVPPVAVPGLDGTTPLTPAGVGPVAAGMTLGQLEELGAAFNIDQSTFDASGGTCFDVTLPGASDLTLRFRSPESLVPVSDPREGILASVNIEAGVGSARLTDVGIGLGTAEEQLRAAHDDLQVSDSPSQPGGYVFLHRADDGSGMAIAYVTNGAHVTEISVGEVEVVRLRQTCV